MKRSFSSQFSRNFGGFKNEAIGRALRDYLLTQEGVNWESFSYKDKAGVNKILKGVAALLAAECTCSPLTNYTDSPHEPSCPLASDQRGGG